MTNSIQLACKAAWPDLFSDDPTVAHQAASPMAVDFARSEKHALVKTILDALAQANLTEAAQKLRKEYRPSMNSEVLHLWAQDVVGVFDSIAASPTPAENPYLNAARANAAELSWTQYSFPVEIEDADGWEFTTPGDEWTRKVYFESEGQGEPSLPGSFTIRFKPGTDEIEEEVAMCNGQILTQRA